MLNLKQNTEKAEELKSIKEESVREPRRHQSAGINKRHRLRFLKNDQSY